MKKLIAVLLVVFAVASFAACDEKKVDTNVNTSATPEQNTEQNAEPEEEREINLDEVLSKEKYDGYEYRILVRKGYTPDQYLEEDSEDNVESAVYKRNKVVEERYGITITASESSSAGYETDALNSILAGDDAYDILFPHSRAAFAYAVQGAAYNINEIESIHLDMPWWSKNIKDNCTVNNRLYVLDGDFTTKSLDSTMSMFFNKTIFDELGFDYPYESVKDGDWTFDEFAYYAKKGSSDLDGDGIINPDVDRMGYVTPPWEMPIGILYTGGQKIYDFNDEGRLELTLYSNKTVDIFDEFFSLMSNEACYVAKDGEYNHFSDGRAMIFSATLGMAQSFRNMDDDFGIIPPPKFDDEDEYATIINGHAPLGIIPITVSDVERTGAITEALAAYGREYVIPAFYDVSLKTKYARDEESEEMMDMLRDCVIYDIGYVAGGTFQSIGRDLAISPNKDFASTYASKESAALEKVEEFNRDYGGFED